MLKKGVVAFVSKCLDTLIPCQKHIRLQKSTSPSFQNCRLRLEVFAYISQKSLLKNRKYRLMILFCAD